ncbi:hypothetical protein [Nostoc favosum]|uniref:Uncharacterized protein n=1 Tax=Nostoc favosum CHAB5714 TaxID=2780399 RepID=A0ABS8I4B2_9NOSO|nr:hypothetical protein [Nostoc favosum]MCC5598654.1 hypothetical protein [Nostoc favosum CHAB5714]
MAIPTLEDSLTLRYPRPHEESNLRFDLVRGQLVTAQKFISSPTFGNGERLLFAEAKRDKPG